jgi:hypothetical protein
VKKKASSPAVIVAVTVALGTAGIRKAEPKSWMMMLEPQAGHHSLKSWKFLFDEMISGPVRVSQWRRGADISGTPLEMERR